MRLGAARAPERRTTARRIVLGVLGLVFVWFGATQFSRLAAAADEPALVTLSIVGTSDLHGAALPRNGGLGGLPLLAGYVNNLRAARAVRRRGGPADRLRRHVSGRRRVESQRRRPHRRRVQRDGLHARRRSATTTSISESVDSPAARQLPGDLRGALKARAAQARYPFLAANLIDEATGRPVEWPNVRPSVLVDAAGVKVGIVGVMTIDALQSTLAANVQGLRIAPLGPAIAAKRLEASSGRRRRRHRRRPCGRALRAIRSARGSVVVRVRVGDLSGGEKPAARAGGRHRRRSHARRARASGRRHRHHPAVLPRPVVRPRRRRPRSADQARRADAALRTARRSCRRQYEGKAVTNDPAIVQAMAPALQRVHELQATPLGVSLDVPIRRAGSLGSPLGNLFAEALRDAVPGADVAAINNAARGLRADLAEGPLTLGRLYDVFPFDNRIARITLSGAELRRWVAGEIRARPSRLRSAFQESTCERAVWRTASTSICFAEQRAFDDDDRLVAVTIGAPTPSGSLASSAPLGGVGPIGNAPVVREVVEDWFRRGHPTPARARRCQSMEARHPPIRQSSTASAAEASAATASPERWLSS